MNQAESCEGAEIARTSDNLMRSFEILSLNFADLERLLKWFSDPDNVMRESQSDHRTRMRGFWLEVDRSLHNYVASVNTLIDHMRRFRKKESHPGFQKSYDGRLRTLTDSDLSSLIPDLRSYFLHFDVPPIGSLVVGGPGENELETWVVLDCEVLLEWSRWKSKSRDFIEQSGTTLNVLEVVQEYQRDLSDFFRWFHKELSNVNRAEIDEYH